MTTPNNSADKSTGTNASQQDNTSHDSTSHDDAGSPPATATGTAPEIYTADAGADTGADAQRDALRAKIEASERRIAERSFADEAREAAGAAGDFVKANPLAVLGSAIALGLLIGALTKPGRRAVGTAAAGTIGAVNARTGRSTSGTVKRAGKKAKKRTEAASDRLADAVVAYGVKLIDEVLDGAQAGQDMFEDFGDSAARRSRKARRTAQYRAGLAADSTRAATLRTRRRTKRAVRDLVG